MISAARSGRKLIETALPLASINAAGAREKSIRHGHPSTLHLWWSRKPLAVTRAVLFSELADDPGTYIADPGRAADERQGLFGIVRKLVLWENTTNETVLEAAREEIRASWRRTCARTGTIRGRWNSSIRSGCRRSTIRSPEAARSRWRRSGSGSRRTRAI